MRQIGTISVVGPSSPKHQVPITSLQPAHLHGAFLLRQVCWQRILLVPLPLSLSLFCCHFQRIFSLATERCPLSSSLPDEQWPFRSLPYKSRVTLPGCFQKLSFVSGLHPFFWVWVGESLTFSCSMRPWASWLYKSVSSTESEIWGHYFFWCFSAPASLSSLSGIPVAQMSDILMLSQRYLKLWSIVFNHLSLCSSNWIISSDFSSHSLTLSSVNPALLFCFRHRIIWFYSFHFFFYSSHFLLRRSLFPFIWCVFTFSPQSIVVTAAVKPLLIPISGSTQGWYLLIFISLENCSHFPGSL